MITEKEARKARAFIVDWIPNIAFPDFIEDREFSSYAMACGCARRMAKMYGSAYVMPVIDGKRVAHWAYSDKYAREFQS